MVQNQPKQMNGSRSLHVKVEVTRLFARVFHRKNENHTAKNKLLTDVGIMWGVPGEADRLCGATLAGHWNEEQAIAEFKKNPGRFQFTKPIPRTNSHVVINMGRFQVAEGTFHDLILDAPSALVLFRAKPNDFTPGEAWEAAAKLKLFELPQEVACSA